MSHLLQSRLVYPSSFPSLSRAFLHLSLAPHLPNRHQRAAPPNAEVGVGICTLQERWGAGQRRCPCLCVGLRCATHDHLAGTIYCLLFRLFFIGLEASSHSQARSSTNGGAHLRFLGRFWGSDLLGGGRYGCLPWQDPRKEPWSPRPKYPILKWGEVSDSLSKLVLRHGILLSALAHLAGLPGHQDRGRPDPAWVDAQMKSQQNRGV